MKGPEKELRALELEASLQRVEYVHKVRARPISPLRADPKSWLYDPIRASILMAQKGQREEAFWLVFLATHCGRNLRTEWLLARELSGAYEDVRWTWARISADPQSYSEWLADNRALFQGKFGNHRKYESLERGGRGTGTVVRSYVEWIEEYGTHDKMVASALAEAKGDPRQAFGLLYDSMEAVKRFGRTGRFDYLTMLAKVGLAAIDANSTYMNGATGPKKGARLLFDGQIDSKSGTRVLEARVAALEKYLGVGMQVLEDAMCNWQKSPGRYLPFRG